MGMAWEKLWFVIRERMGYSDIVALRYQDPNGPLVNEDFAHRDGDAFGKISSILRRDNIKATLPSRKMDAPPRWKNFFLLIKGLLTHPRLQANPWHRWNFIASGSSPDTVASVVWSEARSQAFNERAKSLGVSPGFLLLSEITVWVEKNLFKPGYPKASWMCPVNMRGAFPQATMDDMCVSFVPAIFTLPLTSQSVQKDYQTYRAALKSGFYWGIWELGQVGKWIGLAGMEFLAKKNERKCHWTGTFTDLTKWDQPELKAANVQGRRWIIAPPGSPTHPIGIATIEWCGKRNITVKIHPSVTPEDPMTVAKRLLDQSFS